MAYSLAYQGEFTNRRTNNIRLEIYRNAIVPQVISFVNQEIIAVSVGYPNGNESKYNTIISAEANITLRVRPGSTITPETFLTDLYDEWKVLIYCDDMPVFIGFIEPSEGSYLMKDAPLQIEIKCTDGLGLLKNESLTDAAGVSFLNTTPYLISVIAGCLAKTNLELPIRIYCSIYESSMDDRDDSITADMFQQTRTDYRTFMQNAASFVDCYRALEIILTGGFSIYQWWGRWVISYRPEMQSSIGPTMYYTDYDNAGVVTSGNQDLGVNIVVGYDQIQHPINLDQIISYQVPVKSVKNTFNYTIWDEIPKNSKFERGTEFESGNATDDEDFDSDGDTSEIIGTYKKYTIDDWEQGIVDLFDLPHPSMSPTANKFYRRSIYNVFGVEIDRLIVGETLDLASNEDFWLRSGGVPVYKGDKIKISMQKRFDNDFSTSSNVFTNAAIVYIVSEDNSSVYGLDNSLGGVQSSAGRWFKMNTSISRGLIIDFLEDQDTRKWGSLNIDSAVIPITGTLYFALRADGPSGNTGPQQYNKDISFEYFPYMAGGYVPVKGDYWLTEQNANVKDTIDEEVFISESLKKVIKGSLLRADGTTLTTPTWYRQGHAETRHYKELLNLGKYRHYYRRYRKIQGTFRGVKSTPVNFMGDFYPIGFHKQYAFVDNDPAKMYVFSPPTTIDYVAGTFNTTAIEALDSGNTIDGGVTADQVVNQLIFRINNTSDADWNSAGQAPTPGTPYFPPVAAIYNNTPRSFSIFLDDGNTATASASDNGAGNSPSIAEIYNIDLGNVRWQIFQVGEDVQVGNLFTVTIYGHNVSFTANTPTIYVDENQNGDTHQFGYIF